jgi:hypothetical protein
MEICSPIYDTKSKHLRVRRGFLGFDRDIGNGLDLPAAS